MALGGGGELQVPGDHDNIRRRDGDSRAAVWLSSDVHRAGDFQRFSLMMPLACGGCTSGRVRASSSVSVHLVFGDRVSLTD